MYIRSKLTKGHRYWYLVKGHREGTRVIQTVVRYLGKNPWGAMRPARLVPPQDGTAAKRIFKKLDEQTGNQSDGQPSSDDPYSRALSLAHHWYDEHPELQASFEISRSDELFDDDLNRLRADMPDADDITPDEADKATFTHLTATCLTRSASTLQLSVASRWLREALYDEPDIRDALTRAHLWQLVDRKNGKMLSWKTFEEEPVPYSGPIDTTTDYVLGCDVIEVNEQGYRLRGKLGGEYVLVRQKNNPTMLSPRHATTGKDCPIRGFWRFTDEDGVLRPG